MISNTSLAAQAVANSPSEHAPAAFNGIDWLIAINLAFLTAAFVLFTMLAVERAHILWRGRRSNLWWHPITVWRAIGLFLGVAGFIRFGFGAMVLWGWNPHDPVGTGLLLFMQRLFDPIAATCGVIAIALYKLSERGMSEQLVKKPLPIDMWASLPMLKRPAWIVVLSIVAAVGVVATR